jgi:hypothetical protein
MTEETRPTRALLDKIFKELAVCHCRGYEHDLAAEVRSLRKEVKLNSDLGMQAASNCTDKEIEIAALKRENEKLLEANEHLERDHCDFHLGGCHAEIDRLKRDLASKQEQIEARDEFLLLNHKALDAVNDFSSHIYTNADHEFRQKHLDNMLVLVKKILGLKWEDFLHKSGE